jgi:hypothetical protein
MDFSSTEGVTVAVQAGTRYMLRWENGYALRGVPFMHCDCVFFFPPFISSWEFLMVVLVYGPLLCIMRVLVLCVFDMIMTRLSAFCHEKI